MVILPKYFVSYLTKSILLLQYQLFSYFYMPFVHLEEKRMLCHRWKICQNKKFLRIRKGWILWILVLSYQFLKEKGDILKHKEIIFWNILKKKKKKKEDPSPKLMIILYDWLIDWLVFYANVSNFSFYNMTIQEDKQPSVLNYYSRSLLQDQAGWRVDQQLKYFWKLSLYQPLKVCVMRNPGMN